MKLAKVLAVLGLIVCISSIGKANGGTSSGGGSTAQSVAVTADLVEVILKNIKTPLKFYFNYFQFVGPYSSKETYEVIFKTRDDKSIFNKIETVSPKVIQTGNCIDESGNITDASVVNTEPDTICFDAKALAQKLNSDNVYTKLLALAVHEYSHLLGATEVQAAALQKGVENTVKNDKVLAAFTFVESQNTMFKTQIEAIDRTLAQLEKNYALPSQCVAIATAGQFSSLTMVLRNTVVGALEPLPYEDQIKVLASAMKLYNASYACRESQLRGDYDSKFNGAPEISINTFMGSTVWSFKANLKYVQYGDLQTAKLEIIEAKQMLSEIKF